MHLSVLDGLDVIPFWGFVPPTSCCRGVPDSELLRQLDNDLNRVKTMWFVRWDVKALGREVEDLVTLWLGLDREQPCCEMWAEPGTEQIYTFLLCVSETR